MDLKTCSGLWSLLALWIVIGGVSTAHSGFQARQAEVQTVDVEPQSSGGGGGNPPKCTVTDAQADSTIASLFTNGNSGRNLPENLKQLPAYCSDSRNKITVVKNYQSKCLPTSQIQICLEAWASTVDGRVDSYCRVPANNQPTKEQKKLFDANICSNSVKTPVQKCIKDKICEINEAAKISDPRKRLATICCNLDTWGDCYHSELVKGDKKKCNVQKANDALAFYDNFRKCWTNCLCDDFTPLSDSCKAFRKPSGRSAQFRTGGGGSDCTKGYKSIVGAIIGALKNVQLPPFAKRSAEAIMRSCK